MSHFWREALEVPPGEAVEGAVLRSLQANPFSLRGHVLRRADQQARWHRKRPRDDGDGEATLPKPDPELQRQAQEIQTRLHQLLLATTLPYAGSNNAVRPTSGNGAAEEEGAEAENDPTNVDAFAGASTQQEPQVAEGKPTLADFVSHAKAAPSSAAKATADNNTDDSSDDDDFTPMLPTGAAPASSMTAAPTPSGGKPPHSSTDATTGVGGTTPAGEVLPKHPSQMTREEFLAQFKRPPRRGEVGQSAEEIAAAEQLGYVMSGSHSKQSQLYIRRMQRQLHEREAAKLQQQFRKVEDERTENQMISSIAQFVQTRKAQKHA